MFKIMHWPGANMMGLGSILAMVFVFLPVYFFSGIRNPETKVNTIVSSLVIILGSGLFFTLINTRPSATIERTNVLANQHTQNSYEYILKQNALSYEIVSKDSTLKQEELNKLRTACTNLCKSIEDLKLKLVSASEGIEIKKIDFNTMYGGGDYGVPSTMLFDNNGNAIGDLKQLRKNLSDFNALVSQAYGQKTETLINLGNQLNARDEMVSWEVSNFYLTPISIVLRNLTQIQLDVLNIEANCYAVSR
jgi:hypothetical protein